MKMGMCFVVALAPLCLYCNITKAADVVTNDPEQVDVAPTTQVGQIDHTTLTLPGPDASQQIEVVQERIGASERRYRFSNQGDKDVLLWVYILHKNGRGKVFFYPKELARLKPGDAKKITLTYQDERGTLYGQFRIVTAAARYTEWGDLAAGSRTDAGKRIDAVLRTFAQRVEKPAK